MDLNDKNIILASASPRRVALLQELGVGLTVHPALVVEELIVGRDAVETAWLRAEAKAREVHSKFSNDLVLAADTIVEDSSGKLLGKPDSRQEASEMLNRLFGTRHRVVSVACIVVEGKYHRFEGEAWVSLKQPIEDEIENYLAGGESIGKAGGLCVQGEGRKFVNNIEGEEAVVIGLPLNAIRAFLKSI